MRIFSLPRLVPAAAACVALLLSAGCGATRPYVDAAYRDEPAPPAELDVVHEVFLVGNLGAAPAAEAEPVLDLLARALAEAGKGDAVVYLGDQLPGGLPDSGAAGRDEAEAHLRRLLEPVRGFEGRIVVIPGERDWRTGAPGGYEARLREEAFVEAYLDRGDTFLPDAGYPGPVEVDLSDWLKLIVLDTQWYLTEGFRPYGDTGEYDVEEAGDFLLQLDDHLQRQDNEDVLVVGHHPIFSNGPRGGHFPLRAHLFPLTEVAPWLYVPLPGVGTLYPMYRRYVGVAQDLASPRYRSLREALGQIFLRHERLIYAAAHEHSLQYFDAGNQHHLVSGAGARDAYVARGHEAAFAASETGFMKIVFYEDRSSWLEVWSPGGGGEAELLFRVPLLPTEPEAVDPELPPAYVDLPDYADSTVVAAANPAYAASPFKEAFWGTGHRKAWTQPILAPVLDLGREAGGLTPVKRGGGLQTLSLRLEGADGKEYVLRSIDKDPTKSIPPELLGTAAEDVVQDQISALHPYGAYLVPPLAEAAGVYHTNPKVVFVPDDPRLGIYRERFANRLMMFEERPDDDMSDAPTFGRSEEVISSGDLFLEINADNDHRVDDDWYLRSRLFDMFISDWDRHRDQWRWASFEPYELNPALTGEAREQGKIYRPIPRDRDWAFFWMNGLFPSLAEYIMPKFQDFTESYGNLKGLNFNALELDRRFLSALEREDWLRIADSLQAALTDEAFLAALDRWPEAVDALYHDDMLRIFRARRDKLPEAAEDYYELLAEVVDVVGSDKHERFEVTRLDGERTRVVVYKTSKEGEVDRKLYERIFHDDETEEVRLYGLAGNDQFVVTGDVSDGILVRAVGGSGEDVFVDESRVAGFSRKTRFYDTETGNTWETGPETITHRSPDPLVNEYDPYMYRHDARFPTLFFGYNQDDGVFVGGGVRIVEHGFRRSPYASRQRLRANVAARTRAFNIRYNGHFIRALGTFDVALDADLLSPNNIHNFYGLGNETANTVDDAEFYQARLTKAFVRPMLERRLAAGGLIRFGPSFEVTKVEEDEDRFVGQAPLQAGIAPNTFDDQWFAGADVGVIFESVDSRVNPRVGYAWISEADVNFGVRNATQDYARLTSELSMYVSPVLSPQLTFALRVGGGHNVGDFPFYGANTLGGRENLRGYRGTRFAGRTSFYQNVDLRVKLFTLSTYFALGDVGLLGFFDNGRVWTDDESSDVWHQGYGGGLWLSLFDQAVFTGTYDVSDEEQTVTVKLGFLF